MSNYDCPKCGSEKTQKISVAIEKGRLDNGLTQTDLSSKLEINTDASGGAFAKTIVKIIFYSVTLLAVLQIFALLTNPGPSKIVNCVIGIPAAIVSILLWKYLFNPMNNNNISDSERAHRSNLRENGFYCQRCDNMFVPKGNNNDINDAVVTENAPEKTIVTCPQCSTKARVPTGKNIEVTCPSCKNAYSVQT